MTKHKLYVKVKPQIMKDLLNTLINCKGIFECNIPASWLVITDVVAFNYDSERNESMYRVQIDTQNNTKDIFIASANVEEFTVHF